MSVHGSYSSQDGSAGVGMILRRDDGSVIFATYQIIFNCNEALETEIHALMQVMALALQHLERQAMVQSDSSKALSILSSDSLSRSAYGHLVAEIKSMMNEREFVPHKISRAQNRVADSMTNYSCTESCTARCGRADVLHVVRTYCLSIVTL